MEMNFDPNCKAPTPYLLFKANPFHRVNITPLFNPAPPSHIPGPDLRPLLIASSTPQFSEAWRGSSPTPSHLLPRKQNPARTLTIGATRGQQLHLTEAGTGARAQHPGAATRGHCSRPLGVTSEPNSPTPKRKSLLSGRLEAVPGRPWRQQDQGREESRQLLSSGHISSQGPGGTRTSALPAPSPGDRQGPCPYSLPAERQEPGACFHCCTNELFRVKHTVNLPRPESL